MSSKCLATFSEHILGHMFLPLLVPKSRCQACAGNVVGSKGQVPTAHTLLWASLKGGAPPTIFSARHFFHEPSRNIHGLGSNPKGAVAPDDMRKG